MSASPRDLDQLAINTLRTLSMDAVEKAKSGHPGTPMALAPVAYTVWKDALRYDPTQPLWPARDRFVLSCGHASMLLYSVLHLAGVRQVNDAGEVLDGPAVSLDDLRNFRQLHSPCAGHPEYGEVAGIEMTTGPLGQGVGTSVGMAIAGQWLAARYHRPGFEMFGFRVFVLASDGDLMEGLSHEAASLAGHLQLSNLCWIYDDNHITIEGETKLAFSEDVGRRFEGLGWNVVRVADANDLPAIRAALDNFAACHDRPTLIILRSIIGYGAPNKSNSHSAHGAPLGAEEVRLAKRHYGWPEDAQFLVPPEAAAHFSTAVAARGTAAHDAWGRQWMEYRHHHSAAAAELERMWCGELPADWEAALPVFPADAKGLATRVSSGKVINALAGRIPWFVGGSADLAPSTMTLVEGPDVDSFSADHHAGRNFHFGIREHGMTAIANGLALCGLRPYVGTFFVFSDYLRPALRLASMMRLPIICVLTHDSIGLGEDGPTHQPVEHLAACRAIPGLVVLRPADANEVVEAYRYALSQPHQAVVLVLTRQNVPTFDRTRGGAATGVARGAYILLDPPQGDPQAILLGSGSEVTVCLTAAEQLQQQGLRVRVVSVPSWELFERQEPAYRAAVLPPDCTARVAVEAGVRQGWDRYLGTTGRFVGLQSFGASAPFGQLYEHFGITAARVADEVRAQLSEGS